MSTTANNTACENLVRAVFSIDDTPPPCDGCAMRMTCAENRLACTAFWRYSSSRSHRNLRPTTPTRGIYSIIFDLEEPELAARIMQMTTTLMRRIDRYGSAAVVVGMDHSSGTPWMRALGAGEARRMMDGARGFVSPIFDHRTSRDDIIISLVHLVNEAVRLREEERKENGT